MIHVAVSPAVVIQKAVRAHHALAEQENLHLGKEMEIPANVHAAVTQAVVIPTALVLHALAEQESLRLEKETETPASVQKDFQNPLKKEKAVEMAHSEKDPPIHLNPAQTDHHVLERNLFKKEMTELEVKDLTRKENQAHSNHVRTDLQVSVRNRLQNVKVVVTKNLSEGAAVLLDRGQEARHDLKKNRLIAKMKVVKDHLKTETQVHSIHAGQDQKDLPVSPRSHLQNVKKVVTKNHSKKQLHTHSIQMRVTNLALKRNHFKKEMLKVVKENHL
jgi:hypothetical protein